MTWASAKRATKPPVPLPVPPLTRVPTRTRLGETERDRLRRQGAGLAAG